MRHWVSLRDSILQIGKIAYDLSKIKNIYVLGAGKASAFMAASLESILGDRITEGHIVTKYGHSIPLQKIEVTEAGHPVPDENGEIASQKILRIAQKAAKDDLVICLISGGGSALLADIPEGVSLDEMKKLNDILLRKGLDIMKINTIRKHLSTLKGGRLTRAISPATSVSLILSDVIGDFPDVIASGLTAPDRTTYAKALNILEKHALKAEIPENLLRILEEGAKGLRPETLKEKETSVYLTRNLIIGNNRIALEQAAKKAISLGYQTQIYTHTMAGDVRKIAYQITSLAKRIQKTKGEEKICLLFGGETTVKVEGHGIGGRNQHLALLAAKRLSKTVGITLLCGGTDGTDGPTQFAGAVVDSDTIFKANKAGIDIDRYISSFDATSFFEKAGGLIKTGPTQTNVMDLIVLLVK